MLKVITYGTYDMLHYGHINLLKRAKNLGDYLIVGITADDFDKARFPIWPTRKILSFSSPPFGQIHILYVFSNSKNMS